MMSPPNLLIPSVRTAPREEMEMSESQAKAQTLDERAGASNETHSPPGKGVSGPKELLREQVNFRVGKGRGRGPSDATHPHGSDLAHRRLDVGGQPPTPDDALGDQRAHDVNYEMLARAYRRDLRVGIGHRSARQSLDFLFGGEG